MIKLFASDLDGTLLARSHQFDELIKVTVEKIVRENAVFTISTGRDCSMTELNGLENKIYRICMNGALIMSPEGETLKLDLIDKDILKIILEEFDDLDLEFITPYKTYTKQSKEEFFEKMERMPHPDGDNVEVAKFFMENVSKRLVFDQSKEEILSKDVCKINSHLQPGKSYNCLYKFLEKYSSSIVNAPCDKNLIEITKQGVNKGNAVHWLGQYLHIEDDEIAVYGDVAMTYKCCRCLNIRMRHAQLWKRQNMPQTINWVLIMNIVWLEICWRLWQNKNNLFHFI